DKPEAPWGPPGAIYAAMWVRRKPSPFGGSHGLYSGRAWQRLLSRLEPAYPFHIHMWMFPLDGHGFPLGGEESVRIGVHRLHDNPEWVQLEFEASVYRVPWPGAAEIQGKWVGFLRRWAERLDAC